ncbi:MAG TPA: NADH-quinone oxidoreductase subunit J [Candidatus Binatia bacterium]|nr:NADH-quinone oxidoreductase subunit J [Candidatus Binatia bacterium]
MIIQAIAFWVFAVVAVISGLLVVANRNPVYSVLFLILTFFNAAGLFVLLGAEFLAMMLVVVYVGAVAVLFLFVVMMLDINFVALRQGFVRYLPIGAVVGAILVAELVFIFGGWTLAPATTQAIAAPTPAIAEVSNTQALGQLLYTQYFYLFQAAGMVLLVAMIGAIVLTHRERVGVKRQRIAVQVDRGADSVEIRNVPSGSGI